MPFQETQKAVNELIPIIDKLQNQVDELAKSLIKLDSATKQTAKSQGDLKVKKQQLSVVDQELNKLEKESQRLNAKLTDEYKKQQKEVLKQRDAVKKSTDELKKQAGIVSKSGGLFKNMTKSILAAGTAFLSLRAGFNVLKQGFNTIKDFERGMSEVKAITGSTAEEFKLLEKDALRLGSSTEKTSLEVAGLQKEFAKLGFTTKEIINATEATINLSIAAGSDLSQSAVVAASTIRGFSLSTTEATRVVDVMAKSFTSSALDLDKFQTAMAIAAPVANSFGKDIEFTTAQLSVLSDAGLDASTSGTSLRNIFLELSKRGLTWEEGLQKINESTNKNSTALDLFGKRGATAALILAENVDKAAELESAYDAAAGSAQKMADVMADNLAGDINLARSAWEGFVLSLNEGETNISNTARVLVQGVTTALNKLSDPKIFKIWNKNSGLVAEDFDKILEKSNILETEHGKNLGKIIKKFEELEAFTSQADFFEQLGWGDRLEGNFKSLLQLQGVTAEKSIGLWEAYVRKREEQLRIEQEAEADAAIKREQIIKQETIARELEEAEAAKAAFEKAEKERERILEKRKKRLFKESADRLNFSVEQGKKEADKLAEQLFKENELFEAQLDNQIQSELDITNNLEEEEAKRLQIIKDASDKRIKIKEAQSKLEQEIEQAATQILTDQFNSFIDNRLNKQLDANKTEQDLQKNKLDKGLITEKEYQDNVEKLQADARRKEAQANKKKQLFDVFLDTLKGIGRAISESPLTFGQPWATYVGATGAIRAATIAARPIPAFEHGGKTKKGTYAKVSEKGSELGVLADGTMFLTPPKESMMYLPENTQIFPNYSHETQEALKDGTVNTALFGKMIKAQDRTTKAVERIAIINKTENSETIIKRNIRIKRYTS